MTDLKAYQAFILQGKGAPVTPKTSPTPSTSGSSGGKRNKSEIAALRAFQGRLQEWKDTDLQLESIVGSIANLRERLWWESRQIQTLQSQKPWEKFCHRASLVTDLKTEDIQHALAQDLLHHEKMLSSARNLIASLAQTQDGLGRKLDAWMMMNLEYPLSEKGRMFLDEAQDLYSSLAEIMYRKQDHLKKLLGTCHHGLVTTGQEWVDGEENPRATARKISINWTEDGIIVSKSIDHLLSA